MSEYANKKTRGCFIAAVFAMQGVGILAGGAHDVWEIVEKGFIEPENDGGYLNTKVGGLRDSRKRDKKALCLIYQLLYEDTFEKVAGAKTSKEAWEKLQTSYKGAEQVKKIIGLKFEHIVTVIEETRDKDLETMTMEQLLGSLQAYEEKKKKKEDIVEQVLKMRIDHKEESGRSNQRRGGGHFHGRDRGVNGRGWRPYKTNSTKEERTHQEVVEEETQNQERRMEEDMLLMAYKKDEPNEVHKWYLDSGASNHMCGNKSMFVELDESVKTNVALGDESRWR
ncbi:uncharacterized protein LOC125605974 [Brassica napus]|uniref:uncharacterized protein LOC125605974 n=1 Tax=Brassica napus TaxID=3708 RepID=UPI0020788743|nr:uncharacterized protein LOC125605974 [Brassica napus]